MKLILLISILCLAISPALSAFKDSIPHPVSPSESEICFDGYGCYRNGPPFGQLPQRPTEFLPMSPVQQNIFFTHYKKSLMGGAPIAVNNTRNFDPKLPTTLVVHGWTQSNTVNWMIAIKNNTLLLGDANIILTNWNKGALQLYGQSAQNSRVVATAMANLIKDLIANAGAKLQDIHLVGHSMGGQIVGMVGSQVPGIPKITALDPAGKMWFGTDSSVRLDPSDGLFVNVIHTDILGLGYPGNLGHVDFYPNGGIQQTGCTDDSERMKDLMSSNTIPKGDVLGCSHMYSCHLYADSILTGNSDCQYTGYKCDSYENFKNGECFSCPKEGCNKMGYYCSNATELGGPIYLDTLGYPLYSKMCLESYLVELNVSNNAYLAKGDLDLIFHTANRSQTGILDRGETLFSSGASINRVTSIPSLQGADINSLKLAYTRIQSTNPFIDAFIYNTLFETEYSIDSISIINQEFQQSNFCSVGDDVSTDGTQYMHFNPC